MHAIKRFIDFVLAGIICLLVGCAKPIPPVSSQQEPTDNLLASKFNPDISGTITGQVIWAGVVPEVPSLQSWLRGRSGSIDRLIRPNPNAPRIDPQTRGVDKAVVFLRSVPVERSKPWHHQPVHVEQNDYGLRVRQGDVVSPYGFVRRGAEIEAVSHQLVFHVLRARGAAFFGLTFPQAEVPRRRRLNKNGVVELSSGAGYYWMRAYLFVDDHPYYTQTDPQGRFTLTEVPPGTYEIVCWLPNWLKDHHERDSDWAHITRLTFRQPLVISRQITLTGTGPARADFSIAQEQFCPGSGERQAKSTGSK